MGKITNPILKGFNPDPSIVRVGEDYFIATSTFEWFPGVQIHHSRDLKNWKLIGRALTRTSQLNMLGVPDSCGVWAPCLSYHDGVFHLVFSNVKSFDGTWKDTPNYLVTTEDIYGEWSDPVYLSSSGFDGSMYHEGDRKWYTSMRVDHRKGKFFGGIILQEYNSIQKKLIGEEKLIFEGTEIGLTEGPHLYKRDGYYYLVTAEGGTEYGHAFSVARSKDINGPYEPHPSNPVISSRSNPGLALQKAGHGDFVQTQNGNWYAVFLVGRPLTERGRCTLGRETAIQPISWDEGEWPVLSMGGNEPQLEIPEANLNPHPFSPDPEKDDFDGENLNVNFQSLRVPVTEEWLSLSNRPGYLRLTGRESLSSFHKQSIIARRLQSHHVEASLSLDFNPENFQQMAGLVCYYNTSHFIYLYLTSNDGQRMLNIIRNDKNEYEEPLQSMVPVDDGQVYLKLDWNRDELQFFYGHTEDEWNKIGPVMDASILSDDYVQHERDGRYRAAFTGAFIGMACQDLSGQAKHADFDWFSYKEI